MTDLRAASQQALEALEYHVEQTRPIWKTSEAIAALETALAEPVQEPITHLFGTLPVHDAPPKAEQNRAWYTIDEINAKFDPPQRKPLRSVTYVCPVCAASLERQE